MEDAFLGIYSTAGDQVCARCSPRPTAPTNAVVEVFKTSSGSTKSRYLDGSPYHEDEINTNPRCDKCKKAFDPSRPLFDINYTGSDNAARIHVQLRCSFSLPPKQMLESDHINLILVDTSNETGSMTVTNDAEAVVEYIVSNGWLKNGRRLGYYDSEGLLAELLVRNGKFAGFAPFLPQKKGAE